MNQYDVDTFLAVVRHGSFSKAASQMFTTQATVSHRISALEEELGYQLILRGQGVRKIELTYRGEQFIPIAEQWSSLWSNSLAIRNADYRMPLFIGGTNRLNTHFLPDFYDYFARSSENVVLEIHSYHSWEIFDLIDRKELDIGFASSEIATDNVIATPFLREQLVMVCLRGDYYPSGPIHPQSLDVVNEVRLASNQQIKNWHNTWWDYAEQPYYFVDTAAVAAHLIRTPPLWAVCPRSAATELVSLFPMEIHEFSVEVPFQVSYLCYHRSPRLEKKIQIQSFISAFQAHYRQRNIEGFCL